MSTPAPSLAALLDFETEWDRALTAVAASCVPWTVSTAHGTATLSPPYVVGVFTFGGEFAIAGGTQALQRGSNATAAQFDGTTFLGSILFEIIVDRRTYDTAAMRSTRGGLRAMFLPSAAKFNTTSLPWYSIGAVEEIEGSRSVDEERDLDITSMGWQLRWAIRPEAWPT